MTTVACLLLAVLSIWDYPSRFPQHQQLRAKFVQAVRTGNTRAMEDAARTGTALLPDDATWAYNFACALAYREDPSEALDQLERAIDLGFRDVKMIAEDADLQRLAKNRRFKELLEYAREIEGRPVLANPLVAVPATGIWGESLALGEQNLSWDFDHGCFTASLMMAPGRGRDGNFGDLYMNRDGRHSLLTVTNYPGLTEIKLDREGRERNMDLDFPNLSLNAPVFGNCSRAFLHPVYWRSLPRAMMTTDAWRMPLMAKFYLSNQLWVFPVNADYPPVGTNGDCFASVAPYWLATQGKSWSDQYYLRAALEASRSFAPAVKREIVERGLLAPTIQCLLRRALKGVRDEEDYLSAKAHPTCLPPNGLELPRLKAAAAGMKAVAIPPVATLQIRGMPTVGSSQAPECLYLTPCAAAFILRAKAGVHSFLLQAAGGDAYTFRQVHGESAAVKFEPMGPGRMKVTLRPEKMTGRVDLAVFAKTAMSEWGAPSYVSFSVPAEAPAYVDPVLYPPPSK